MMSHPSYPLNLTPVEVRLLREHLPSEELGCLESVQPVWCLFINILRCQSPGRLCSSGV